MRARAQQGQLASYYQAQKARLPANTAIH